MKFEALKFETPCACSTLRRAARAVTAAYDAALAPSGLRITQFGILRKLAHFGPLPVTRLAAEAALDRSTMGRNLNPLERRGLVRIKVGNADQRERVAYLTAAGEAALHGNMNSKPRMGLATPKKGGIYLFDKCGYMPALKETTMTIRHTTLAAALALAAIGAAHAEGLKSLHGQVIDLGDVSGVASPLLKPWGVKP